MIDSQFADSTPDRLHVTKVAVNQASDPGLNAGLGHAVTQALEPPVERRASEDVVHL